MPDNIPAYAPGAPGIPPTWCSSAKEMVGCALGPGRLWFTLGGGIVNEVYYPRVDIPQIRDLGFIVADDNGFWVELKRLGQHDLHIAQPGIPAVRIVHQHERFTLSLRVTPDPERDVLLIDVTLEGADELRVYALLAPHLGGTGHDNIASVENYRGRKILWAEQGPFGLALAAVDHTQHDAWCRASAGYVGFSDGWQDFKTNGAMRWNYSHAGPGNVALLGELPRQCVLALGFGSSKESAATLAISSLLQSFDNVWQKQIASWQDWHNACGSCSQLTSLPVDIQQAFSISAMVLRVHQDKTYPGAMVASLSVPWGSTRDERGGYHLVWPRDMVECATALLAIGAIEDARNVLRYLIASQHDDGHWYQNQWLGGKPYWQGVQLDESAFPVLLAVALAERDALDGIEVQDMVQRALHFIARTGPASDQDRWEEDAGVNCFTLTICIAALVAGAKWLPAHARDTALDLADYWNTQLDDWTAVRNNGLTQRYGVNNYYARMAPAQTLLDEQAIDQTLPIKNLTQDPNLSAAHQIGTDFLQLVRFGLRKPDDDLICDTLKIVDDMLRVQTPTGLSWHRYNGDGYGEHEDGSAFDGTGCGRAWPLLTGERGHYELSAGGDALPYLRAMVAMSGNGGMMPEQIWDSAAITEHALYPGHPSGSAMPLVWAHAEFIKLARSYETGRPFDRPEAVWQRYQGHRPQARYTFCCEHAPVGRMSVGSVLRICLLQPGVVIWSQDNWNNIIETATRDSGLGLHMVEISGALQKIGDIIEFTYQYAANNNWAGRNFKVAAVEKLIAES